MRGVSPALFERYALPLWPYRWRLGVAALATPLLFIALIVAARKLGVSSRWDDAALALIAPAMCWPWGLMLIGTWFHPEHGTMRPGSPWFLRAPRAIQAGFRWYAAFFLVLWFAVPLVAVAMMLFE
jgi:hypothetical protein